MVEGCAWHPADRCRGQLGCCFRLSMHRGVTTVRTAPGVRGPPPALSETAEAGCQCPAWEVGALCPPFPCTLLHRGCPGGSCPPGMLLRRASPSPPAGKPHLPSAWRLPRQGQGGKGKQREEAEMGGNGEKFFRTRHGAAAGLDSGGGFVFATKKAEASVVSAGANAGDASPCCSKRRQPAYNPGDCNRCAAGLYSFFLPTLRHHPRVLPSAPTSLVHPNTPYNTRHIPTLKSSSSFTSLLPPASPAAVHHKSPFSKTVSLGFGAVSAEAGRRHGVSPRPRSPWDAQRPHGCSPWATGYTSDRARVMFFGQELKLKAARVSGMKGLGVRIQPQPLRRLCPRHVRGEAPEPRKRKV